MNAKQKTIIIGMTIWGILFIAHYFIAVFGNKIIFSILTIPCMLMFLALHFTKSE